jgi:hypothetical protein
LRIKRKAEERTNKKPSKKNVEQKQNEESAGDPNRDIRTISEMTASENIKVLVDIFISINI